MREILFRGKRTDNGEWVYGDSLIHSMYKKGDVCIGVTNGMGIYSVNEETIGQYIGLKDKNGNKIFEGDIIVDNFFKLLPNKPHIAKYYEAYRYGLKEELEIEIIGNIYDNHELLKDGE